MSKIAIIGASGNVGTQLVAEALSRNHTVTAIARDPSKLGVRPDLNLKPVDLNDSTALLKAIAGHDVVISSVRFSGLVPGTLINVLKQSDVDRFIVVGGAASLNLADGTRLLDSPHFPAEYKPEASAAVEFLAALRQEHGLVWTFVSPSMEFLSGERTGKFRTGLDDLLTDGKGRSWISYQDFAVALLDEIEKPAHLKQRFTVGY
ncbi:NAD(P)-dependent oxidoreductase [Pseudomonas sp. TH49]|uniref:NAD(P)-dependent oxidoreductase n=1 Tax=Pseudomonas sp. TH49 TaxID=2796413 RepID=UPI0019115C93|nr:NAD(P)-dependent oxidoreductase [Pseudomonas sp. TH49]MBK5344677.1 NAD(P)-dependent oxidoreductase [Pseudomonas sp. TH49]